MVGDPLPEGKAGILQVGLVFSHIRIHRVSAALAFEGVHHVQSPVGHLLAYVESALRAHLLRLRSNSLLQMLIFSRPHSWRP